MSLFEWFHHIMKISEIELLEKQATEFFFKFNI